MRVVKRRNRQRERQVVCTNCGSTLAYVSSDVKTDEGTNWCGEDATYSCVDCPVCKVEVVLR